MKLIKTGLHAMIYILFVTGLTLFLIYYFEIRIEGWGAELLKYSLKVYLVPLFLCFTNSFLLVRALRIKHHVIWFLLTVIPNFLFIKFFKAIQTSGNPETAVVSIDFFPKYQLEFLFLLPWSISIIQFILTLYYLFKIRQKANLSKA